MAEYKVLLTASGLGSRLGNITDYTNKSLVRIGTKPAISYIVESYPDDVTIVVTLGHFGSHVKDFLQLAYPEKTFEFVEIDKYSGEGSSLGYSMLQSKNLLQCPFIFHACDTITQDSIPAPDYNWMAGHSLPESSQYRTLQVRAGDVFKINEKGELNYDYVYVGLAGIKDYQSFWSSLEEVYKLDSSNNSISDCHALALMTEQVKILPLKSWYDIGNTTSLKYAREHLGSGFKILDKVDENIFIFDNFVIKFFYDKVICSNRVTRVEHLNGTAPTILGHSDNFYKYKLIEGELLSETLTPNTTEQFLSYVQSKLWINKVEDNSFKSICYDFYINKSKSRIKKYLESVNRESDSTANINGLSIPPIEQLIAQLEEQDIYATVKTYFHGDFILDNIIDGPEGFTLIDWRQDFGGQVEFGDVYYDLAKFNHNLTFNHDIVTRGLYSVEENGTDIKVDILISKRLLECQEIFHTFIQEHGYDLQKVKLLTAVIWINMAPLHEYPLSKFLFNFGKYHLYRALNNE